MDFVLLKFRIVLIKCKINAFSALRDIFKIINRDFVLIKFKIARFTKMRINVYNVIIFFS